MHLAINWGSCDHPLLEFDHLLEWLTELREALIYIHWLYNKGYDEGYRLTLR